MKVRALNYSNNSIESGGEHCLSHSWAQNNRVAFPDDALVLRPGSYLYNPLRMTIIPQCVADTLSGSASYAIVTIN